jgi:hypothetical protein
LNLFRRMAAGQAFAFRNASAVPISRVPLGMRSQAGVQLVLAAAEAIAHQRLSSR